MLRPAHLAISLLLTGCVPELPRSRTWISDEVSRRNGTGLRTVEGTELAMPPGARVDDGVTDDEAIAIALWNNAQFQAELSQLGVARGDLADAGVLPNPILTILLPLGVKQLEVTARQPNLGSLWQRGSRIAAASKDAERVAESLVQRADDLVRDVRVACARVRLAEQLVVAARELAAIWTDVNAIALARVRLGDASRAEAEAIRADLVTARLAVDQATTNADTARLALRYTLGVPRELAITLAPPADEAPLGTLVGWRTAGLSRRADLLAAKLAIEAAGERAGLERARIFDFVGILDMNGFGREIGPGLELPLPIFDHRQGARIRARAELERASWAYVETRARIEREVGDAYARAVRADELRRAWRDEVVVARTEARRLAAHAFELGEESHLVVLDTTRALATARQRLAELDAELAIATAELIRAVGGDRRAP